MFHSKPPSSLRPLVADFFAPLRAACVWLAALVLAGIGAVAPAQADTLGEALDAPGLTWTTGGNAPWFFQTAITHDGVDAAQCGHLTSAYQSSWVETTVTGRVSVVFWWKLSADATYYNFGVLTNGQWNWSLPGYGERPWQPAIISLPSGTNTIRWMYTTPPTDPTNWAGNAAWLDQVLVTNIAGLAPVFLLEPPTTLDLPEYSYHLTNLIGAAVGDIPMTYQWLRNGTNLPAVWPFYQVTSSSLLVYPRTQAECGGEFRLVASNQWGLTTSTVCTVTIVPSPPYVPPDEPADTVAALGGYFNFWVSVYGSRPFAYQWYKDGSAVPGATNAYHEFWPVTEADAGLYHCVVTNLQGAATSRVAQLTVSTNLPTIVSGPSPETIEAGAGDSAGFYVEATGPEWLSYSWRKVGEPDELASWDQLNFSDLDPTNSGLYHVIVSNQNGAVTSPVGVLAVAPITALALALDVPQLLVTNLDQGWPLWAPDVNATNTHDGLCAARSPELGDWDARSFRTTVSGPTNVSFWWRISAGAQAFLEVAVAGSVRHSISGETDWQKQMLTLPAGEHELTWTFRKEHVGYVGQNAAWVDRLVIGDSGDTGSEEVTAFTSGGDAEWFPQSTNTRDGVEAWQSGVLGDDAESWLEATVNGPGTLSFWWMVESEECCDPLEFSVDGAKLASIAGEVPWQRESFELAAGSHTLRWRYAKDGSVSVGLDAGWVDEVFINRGTNPPVLTLAEALNATNRTFTTGGEADWFAQTAVSHDGVAAAQSGAIGDSLETWLATHVQGPGTLSFWWKVSSEEGADWLELWVDGSFVTAITGEQDWAQYSLSLQPGWHSVYWIYSKDGSVANGADAAWVDQVQLSQPAGATLTLSIERNHADGGGGEHFLLFPQLSSVTPDAITQHRVQSPNALFQGAVNNPEWGSSSRWMYTLESLIEECTNGVWTLFLNKDDPSEQRFTFLVSIQGLDTNLLGLTTIHTPTNGSLNVPANVPFHWTGPSHFPYLWADFWSFEGGASAGTNPPSTTTHWLTAPPMSAGTNRFRATYWLPGATNVSFTLPRDAGQNPLSSWITSAGLRSSAMVTFVVSPASGGSLLSPRLVTGGLRLDFQSQPGRAHTIEGRTNLTEGVWRSLTNFTGDGALWQFTFPISETPGQYFRARTD